MSAPWPLKFHTDDVNQCLHNKSGSLGVPNVNLFCFMFPQSIMVKFCVLPRTSSSKTQMLLLKKYIHSSNIDCIVVDSSRLHLTFVAFCLSLINSSYNVKFYYINQSELLSRLQTDFMSSVWNFCNRGTDVPLGEVSFAERRQERAVFCRLCPVVWDKWSSC